MTTTNFDEKENELKAQFDNEQKEALAIEEQIKQLQAKHQEKIVNMTRLQGAFALLKDLKDTPEKTEKTEKTN